MSTDPVLDDPSDALGALFEDRFAPMVRLATLLTGSTHVAEEVVMDAFTRLASRLAEVDELWQRLDRLRPEERTCIVMRFYLDLPLAEIAEQLGIPLGTVKSHLHRAVATLRDLLTEEDR